MHHLHAHFALSLAQGKPPSCRVLLYFGVVELLSKEPFALKHCVVGVLWCLAQCNLTYELLRILERHHRGRGVVSLSVCYHSWCIASDDCYRR